MQGEAYFTWGSKRHQHLPTHRRGPLGSTKGDGILALGIEQDFIGFDWQTCLTVSIADLVLRLLR